MGEKDSAWVQDSLAALGKARGWSVALAAPVVEPGVVFFPEAHDESPRSVKRLLRRLMKYAGMRDFDVTVEPGPAGTARFVGLSRGLCAFSIGRGARERLGSLAREVTRAWLALHDLEYTDPVRVAIGSSFLGFGALVGRDDALPAEALGSAVAVLAAARGQNIEHLRGVLAPGVSAVFEREIVRYEHDPSLLTRLGLPPREAWPSIEPPDQSVRDVTDEIAADEQGDERRESRPVSTATRMRVFRPNDGAPVFRIVRTRAWNWAAKGALMMGLVGMVSTLLLDVRAEWSLCATALMASIAWLLGRLRRDDYCSERTCEAELRADADTCPRCGGHVLGELKSLRELPEAERLAEEQRDDEARLATPKGKGRHSEGTRRT